MALKEIPHTKGTLISRMVVFLKVPAFEACFPRDCGDEGEVAEASQDTVGWQCVGNTQRHKRHPSVDNRGLLSCPQLVVEV